MKDEYCISKICFFPLESDLPQIFGFSEFLSALALMILAWTIADIRYRFRVSTAPLPLYISTFIVVSVIGVLTLLSDLWRAENWYVPRGVIFTPGTWQAFLGGILFFTFILWIWYAFIKPAKYSKWNYKKYAQTLYRYVLKGSEPELKVIADELSISSGNIIQYAESTSQRDIDENKRDDLQTAYANDILSLIADKRLCKNIVSSSPGTILSIFHEMEKAKKYKINIHSFARNIIGAALDNTDSFLYHETESYETGLIGYHKPISQAMFSNYQMVEDIGTLFDQDVFAQGKWTASQWEVYCRIVLITFKDYVNTQFWNHSYALFRAKGNIERAVSNLYQINQNSENMWQSEEHEKLRVVVDFIVKAIEIIEESSHNHDVKLRTSKDRVFEHSFYDHLASMAFEVIFHAASVKSPNELAWDVQHNAIWSKLFNFSTLDNKSGKIFKHKLRRKLYDEIIRLEKFPNFKGAKILSFCLNVMGIKIDTNDYYKDTIALQKAVHSWTRKNFHWLYEKNPRLADDCLVDNMRYDFDRKKIVHTFPKKGLITKESNVYFNVN